MASRRILQVLGAMLTLALWLPATAFFALVGWIVAREIATARAPLFSPIVDLHGAFVTGAYSLGGAVVGLGLAWLALPQPYRKGLAWAGGGWVAVTAMLLAVRQVSGWPLLVAAMAATVIGVDVNRRALLAFRASARPAPREAVGQQA
jgi:hypothetical protein